MVPSGKGFFCEWKEWVMAAKKTGLFRILMNPIVFPKMLHHFLVLLLVGGGVLLPGAHAGTVDVQAGETASDLEFNQVVQTTNTEHPALLQGTSGELVARMGKGPTSAPITIVEFADFQCPFCVKVVSTLESLLERYPDQVRLMFKHLPLPMHPKAPLAHEASIAAGAQGQFWAMHDLLSANLNRMDRVDLLEYAEMLDLDVAQFGAALDSGQYRDIVEADVQEAQRLGITGTPTFFINGRKVVGAQPLAVFETIIREELGLAPLPSAPAQSSMLPTAIPVQDSPVQGYWGAPVTIVEYSDFECPYCQKVTPTLRQVLQHFDGQVRVVFKHFPLPFHPDALLAHHAALAAREQEKFWEMHDVLFDHQRALKSDDLMTYARQIGLDLQQFSDALKDSKLSAHIEQDRSEGTSLGVTGTPTFFVNGTKMVGAQSFEVFQRVIASALGATPVSPVPSEPETLPVTVTGPATAPVKVTVFADFHSPLSAQVAELLRTLPQDYRDQAQVAFKHFPLPFHPKAKLAHEAAVAAGVQGQFWAMHDWLFQHQGQFEADAIFASAKLLGLDAAQFQHDVLGHAFLESIRQDMIEGRDLNVRGVPTLFINDVRLDGVVQPAMVRSVIDRELAASLQAKR